MTNIIKNLEKAMNNAKPEKALEDVIACKDDAEKIR